MTGTASEQGGSALTAEREHLGDRPVRRTREAVGVFDTPANLEAAVQQLAAAGFDKGAISVLGSGEEIKKHFGRTYGVAALEDDPRAPRAPFISAGTRLKEEMAAVAFPLYVGGVAGLAAVVASGGALAVAIAGFVVGSAAGVGIGGLLAEVIAERHRKHVEEQVARGGLVIWVKVSDTAAQRRARAVLEQTGAHDVHIHEMRYAHRVERQPESSGQ